jgi:hypothetical protein
MRLTGRQVFIRSQRHVAPRKGLAFERRNAHASASEQQQTHQRPLDEREHGDLSLYG